MYTHLTRASLRNLLRRVGFTSVYECLNPCGYHNPSWPRQAEDDRRVIYMDRTTFVAIKGQNQRVISSPITQASPEIDRPDLSPRPSPRQLRLLDWRRPHHARTRCTIFFRNEAKQLPRAQFFNKTRTRRICRSSHPPTIVRPADTRSERAWRTRSAPPRLFTKSAMQSEPEVLHLTGLDRAPKA